MSVPKVEQIILEVHKSIHELHFFKFPSVMNLRFCFYRNISGTAIILTPSRIVEVVYNIPADVF
jgi:hypothetical protein